MNFAQRLVIATVRRLFPHLDMRKVLAGDTDVSRLSIQATTWYWAWCHRHGQLVWDAHEHNLVVIEGLNTLLNRTFHTPGADANWYVMLKGPGTIAAGDTMASHAGWSEVTAFSNVTRPAWTPNTTASGGAMSNSSSVATFNMNAPYSAAGCAMTSNNTVSGTTGLIFGAVNFGTQRDGDNPDIITVRADLSVEAA